MSKIALVICTYNNADMLDRALEAAAAQSLAADQWSMVVVDNNSKDDTASVVNRWASEGRLGGVKYFRESRQGLGYARRRAVRETSEPWIAFIDDDCLIAPSWIEEVLGFIDMHPATGALGGQVLLRWPGEVPAIVRRFDYSYASQELGSTPCLIGQEGWLVGAGLVLRREALLSTNWMGRMAMVGRRGNALSAGDDTEMVLRIRNAGYELWYNPEMQLEHLIEARRCRVDYLCRLQRGMGRTLPFLELLRRGQSGVTFTHRIKILRKALRMYWPILGQRLKELGHPSDATRVEHATARGRVEGALSLLVGGYQT